MLSEIVGGRQIPYDVTHIWNLKQSRWAKGKKSEKDKPRNRALIMKNKLMVVTRGEVV